MAEGVGSSPSNTIAPPSNVAPSDEDDRVATRILAAIGDEQLSEVFNIEFVFGNHATIGGASQSGKHGGQPGVAAEDSSTIKRSCDPAEVRKLFTICIVRVTQVLKPMQ